MRRRRVLAVASTTVLAGVWLAGVSAGAQHQHSQPQHAQPAAPPPQASVQTPGERELKVGKKGDIEFRAETLVGELQLKPARYQFQHRVEGSDHFVHFTELTKARAGQGAPKAHPGEVKCRLEALGEKADRTKVYTRREDGVERLTRVLVAGENVAHVF